MRTSETSTAALPCGADRWPLVEQRRMVTVLFADIVGSTALVEGLDPEDVRALQHAYFDTVAEVLHRWGGVVEKYIGDAVVAVFGVPGSDEHDAYRAVRAGLQVQEAMEELPLGGTGPVRIRVGLATGEVVVDLDRARDGGYGAISGAVLTSAARLQEYAPAGAVLACPATQRATEELVRYTELPAGPAGTSAVTGARLVAPDPPPPRPAPGRKGVPLVGRRRELAAVRDQITRSAREERPRWVSLVGPAGIGKSRLVRELVETVRAVDDEPVRWFVGRCPPYPGMPLAPLADMLAAAIGHCGQAGTPHQRLTALLDPLPPAARPPGSVAALTALLSSTAPIPTAEADRAAQVWQRVLLATAARGPTVVVADGLERAAPAVIRFLRALFAAAVARQLPLTVLVTHRPEWAEALTVTSRELRRRVAVPPLRAPDVARLARLFLTDDGRDPALADRVVSAAGGNPRYAEEYARLLGGQAELTGAEVIGVELPVPEAVHRIASAGLDRLDGPHRAVVTAGAVLGTGLTAEAVACLLDIDLQQARTALHRLVATGLLVRHPADRRYRFTVPALRQVAYSRLPRDVRTELHRRATRWQAATTTLHVRFGRREADLWPTPAQRGAGVPEALPGASRGAGLHPVPFTASRAG